MAGLSEDTGLYSDAGLLVMQALGGAGLGLVVTSATVLELNGQPLELNGQNLSLGA